MRHKESDAAFLAAVEQSFLNREEKEELVQAARRGIDQKLWARFNDLLIAAIVRTQGDQRRYSRALDAEIDRYTAEYEKEKSILDQRFREELARTSDGAEKMEKWGHYERERQALQKRFVKEVRDTSTTLLHDVILATVPVQGD